MKTPAPYFLLGLGAVLISFSSVFVKIADVGPIAAGFYRVFFGGIVLLVMVLIKGYYTSISRRGFRLSILCAVLFALDLSAWHISIHAVGPGLATVLSNFQVLFLAGIGVFFFKEKAGWKLTLAICLALFGLFLLVGPGWNTVGRAWKMGVLFGLLTALFYAAYILSVRNLQTGQSFAAVAVNITLLSFLTAVLMAGETLLAGESFIIPNTKSFLALAGYGFFSQVLGWILISHSLPRINVSIAGLLILLQPALSFIWDMLFFNRPTGPLDILGAACALCGIYMGLTRNRS